MSVLGKCYAIVIITFFLGLQLFAARPSGGRRLWPFTSYPMYSTARYRTDEVRQSRLVGVPCGAVSSSSDLSPEEFGMTEYKMSWILRVVADSASRLAASPERRARLMAELQDHVLDRYGRRYCALEIWERVYLNDGRIRAAAPPPWQLAKTVPLDSERRL